MQKYTSASWPDTIVDAIRTSYAAGTSPLATAAKLNHIDPIHSYSSDAVAKLARKRGIIRALRPDRFSGKIQEKLIAMRDGGNEATAIMRGINAEFGTKFSVHHVKTAIRKYCQSEIEKPWSPEVQAVLAALYLRGELTYRKIAAQLSDQFGRRYSMDMVENAVERYGLARNEEYPRKTGLSKMNAARTTVEQVNLRKISAVREVVDNPTRRVEPGTFPAPRGGYSMMRGRLENTQ